MNRQQGFTLIELVMVIVILGILAATALPKFVSLEKDAKVASLRSMKASLQTAVQMAHAKSLIQGRGTGSTAQWIDWNGDGGYTSANDIVTIYGYPQASTNGLNNLLDLDGFTRSGTSFRLGATPNCEVQYAGATSTAQPSYTIVDSGC